MGMYNRGREEGSRKIDTASSSFVVRDDTYNGIFLSLSSFFFLADFGFLSVPLFHKPVSEIMFLPCSGRLCLMEMEGTMSMYNRVR